MTGANKGIGYGIVETILKNAGEQVGSYHILLSSRDVAAGESAAAEIRSKYPGSKIQVVQLDIANKQSIAALVGRLQQEGGIDVLMNNAGFAFKGPRIDSEVISVTLSINYWGTKNLTEALLAAGLVKPQGKIVVVSSLAGKFRDLSRRNPAVFAQLSQYKKGSLTVEELDAIVRRFESEMEDEARQLARDCVRLFEALPLDLHLPALAVAAAARQPHPGLRLLSRLGQHRHDQGLRCASDRLRRCGHALLPHERQ